MVRVSSRERIYVATSFIPRSLIADACPREAVEAWAAQLRQEHPTGLFRSSSACLPVSPADAASARVKGKGKERERADDAWGLDSLSALLQPWAKEK